ncbi:hypothetical protein [Sphingobacterium sp. UBA6320]|uniref:hypothetical protein n=1 Tax=Sphingobacterium sp. UBA6320 TaxID=1947510 RepID=UPI0025EDF123|nr:hypothetical protein [Sphingobacterium sp. UBA6320]
MLYNPFEQRTRSTFQEFLEQGYRDFVLQRFEWTNISKVNGLMLLLFFIAEKTHAKYAYLN